MSEIESVRMELEAAKINLVAYGDEIIKWQKLANYYDELYHNLLQRTEESDATLIRYHDGLKSIADSQPEVIKGVEWRMERQDAIKRAKKALGCQAEEGGR